jgi:hypothetical protein
VRTSRIALALLQAVQHFGSTVLLASRRVPEAGRLVVAFAVLNLAVPVAGAFLAGLRGVWYGLGVALLITAFGYLRALHVRPAIRASRPELRELLRRGRSWRWPHLVQSGNIDQLVIAKTRSQLAFYTIAQPSVEAATLLK